MKMIVGATLALLTAAAAHGQALTRQRELVWPAEFSNQTFSCKQFHAARAGYMRVSRPRFNCTQGVDCAQDLQPGEVRTMQFNVYYNWLDNSQSNVDVTFGAAVLDTIKAATQRLVRDMDGVVRSKQRAIVVIGHTDTSGTAAQNQQISETLATCVKDIVEVSIHLNGYEGAYDFPMTLEARGETDLAQPTRDGVREPLNRRGEITIRY